MRIALPNNRLRIGDGNRLYLPSDISSIPFTPLIWWDGSDASKIIVQTGVSQVTDKGSYGVNLIQPTASNQPIFNNVQQNGHSTISFDKVSDHQLYTASSNINIDNTVLAIACKPMAINNQYNAVVSFNGDEKDFQFQANHGQEWRGLMNASDYNNGTFDTVNSLGIPQMLSITGNTTTGRMKGYKDGIYKWDTSDYIGWDAIDIVMRIAVNRNSSRWMSMDFYELIIAPESETVAVHTYLMDKWGI